MKSHHFIKGLLKLGCLIKLCIAVINISYESAKF